MVAAETYTKALIAATSIWTLLDQRRYQAIVEHLTPECAWQRAEGWRQGHDELRASFAMRPAELLTRHVVTNFLLDEAADGQLRGSCYLTVYATHAEDHGKTHPIGDPLIIGDVEFEFTRANYSVLVSKVSNRLVFAREANAD